VGGRPTPEAYLALGELRHFEATTALAELGVPAEDLVYLGYPDGGLEAMRQGPDAALVARTSRSAVPYAFSYNPDAPFTAASLAADMRGIIEAFAPTAAVYPDPGDSHGDHAATSAFVTEALDVTGGEALRLTYVTHRGHHPFPWLHLPEAFVQPPPAMRTPGVAWHSVTLGDAALAAKRRALGRYESQLRIPDLRVYLHTWLRRNELFASRETVPAPEGVQSGGPPPA
jgi:LmbE family N-acetylglucosaminyl deacetylase